MTTETISTTAPPADRPHRRRWISVLIWILVTPFAAWAVLRTTGWDAGFRWIQLVAFTPYVAAASVAVALLALVLRRCGCWPPTSRAATPTPRRSWTSSYGSGPTS
ncbi:hypothetical protein FHR32_005459 [Streptosporangium album]|uniref:Uncharacterized protein n=1 Tax=Streptosporangium album TaxID=47479 RepID=A0A7W7WB37_9ACTN|nr:hypothetical protein [Streptosporangium album]MBB4941082.1 hypothetical protein [Streptosporangium album]